MTLLARNEADILASWLDYHLAMGVDLIIATDHSSIDETPEILRVYEKTGKVVYHYEPAEAYLQSERVSKMARQAFVNYQADWVINADADEFYVPTRGTLKTVLTGLPQEVDVLTIKRHNLWPLLPPVQGSAIQGMIYRKRVSLDEVMQRPLVDKMIHRGAEDVCVGRGAHNATSQRFQRTAPCDEIYTLHFPLRSWEQFQMKIQHSGSNHIKNSTRVNRYTLWAEALEQGDLQKVYESYCLHRSRIPELLTAGEIVEDRSILNVLKQIKPEISESHNRS